MALTSPVLNSNNKGVVNQQLLDEVVFGQYNDPFSDPYMASVRDEMVMRQKSTDTSAHTTANFAGPGLFSAKTESHRPEQDSVQIDQYETTLVNTFAKDVDLSMEFFEDEEFDIVVEMLRELGLMARITSEIEGMGIYRDNATTNDGVGLISNSHLTINGDTVDNRVGSALSPDSLNDAITLLGEQQNQRGVLIYRNPRCLLTPYALFKDAVEQIDSELLPDTADNNINVVMSRYGIEAKRSSYLGAAQGGNDTYWWLLADRHTVTRIDRKGLETDLVNPEFTDGLNYRYRANYREAFTADSYEGIVGYIGA